MNASERAPYSPTWYTATMVPASARPPLTYDLDVDVCVIGAGLAGLTTAREIARRGWSVAVLEGHRIASSASGRNDGFVLPGFACSMDRLVSRVGLDHAKALWALSETGVKYVRTTIAEARLPGVAPIAGWLRVSKTDTGDEILDDAQLYGGEFGAEVELWPAERVRDVLRTNHYFHALHLPRAFHIHPLNYAIGLARAAEAVGARIFEETPALEIDPAGVRKRVTTPSSACASTELVIVSLTIVRPASSVTPFPSRVASVRAKRATSTLASRSPSSGARSRRPSQRNRTSGERKRQRAIHTVATMMISISHQYSRKPVPRKITTWVGSGSALPACAKVCWNFGTTKPRITMTDTTATAMMMVG